MVNTISITDYLSHTLDRTAEKMFPEYKPLPPIGTVPLTPGTSSDKFPSPIAAKQVMPRGAIMNRKGKRIISSLPVQVLLYFNVYLFLFWFIGMWAVIRWKMQWFNMAKINGFLTNILFAIFTCIEPGRLWLGYVGNLREQVPHLSGTLLLTLFPQLLIAFYFAAIQDRIADGVRLPFESAINGIYIFFLIAELGVGYVAAKRMIRIQAAGVVAGMGLEFESPPDHGGADVVRDFDEARMGMKRDGSGGERDRRKQR
ncbi:Transmembrane protein 17 [Rhizophlyctis rosea]|nr:Transmembrane protein 17 [Rhizophlyctis rosea]